jgi:cobalt-precorrin 5A hydrolase
MGGDESMIAIGIGCRRGTAAGTIVKIVRQVLPQVAQIDEPIGLFSVADKADETGLLAASAELGLPLTFLSREALKGVEDRIVTPSRPAEAALGIASVSEAAALSGAGPAAVLVIARVSGPGVTCAVARGGGQ